MFETIVALATPPMRSALAIVRLSGDDVFEVISKMFSRDITKTIKSTIYHGFILDGDDKVDEVVLLAYKGPKSFTGEDSVEIMTHGSPLIFNKVINLAIKNGARMAVRGEFSSRSYLHNKMDLLQAESINDLINAESEESKKKSMMALTGEVSNLIIPIKKSLGDLLSLIEVNINYPEYTDIEEADYKKIVDVSNENIKYISSLIKSGKKGKIIKDGINVAIVGKPNVGKSSILNALLNEEKAIVTNIKGTTRDVVEGKMILNGIVINLFDTAGIRESNDMIESKGIIKSEETLKKADLVLVVFDSTTLDDEDKKVLDLVKDRLHIIVYNKSDLISKKDSKLLFVSALNKDIEPLKAKIIEVLGLSKEDYDNPSINNAREIGLLENIVENLKLAISDSKNNVPIDLINVHIQDAYLKVLALLGEDHDFDIANEIFSRFCLGK
ncbi:MAG: tRNA uridine-5-carboxymethylaminomethyl(34) synthesis GTPase MnmE [Bacilli bacterium]